MDAVRRLVAAGMILAAVIGLMPMVPLVFGYYSATVTNNNGNVHPQATATPTTQFVSCWQNASPIQLRRNQTINNVNFEIWCKNNWTAPVAINLSFSATTVGTMTITSGLPVSWASVSSGQSVCQTVVANVRNNSNGTSHNRYQVYVNQGNTSADLYAAFQYRGAWQFNNSFPTSYTNPCP